VPTHDGDDTSGHLGGLSYEPVCCHALYKINGTKLHLQIGRAFFQTVSVPRYLTTTF